MKQRRSNLDTTIKKPDETTGMYKRNSTIGYFNIHPSNSQQHDTKLPKYKENKTAACHSSH